MSGALRYFPPHLFPPYLLPFKVRPNRFFVSPETSPGHSPPPSSKTFWPTGEMWYSGLLLRSLAASISSKMIGDRICSKGTLNMTTRAVLSKAQSRRSSGDEKRTITVFTSACAKERFAWLSNTILMWLCFNKNSCKSFPYPTSSQEFEVIKQNDPFGFRRESPWK